MQHYMHGLNRLNLIENYTDTCSFCTLSLCCTRCLRMPSSSTGLFNTSTMTFPRRSWCRKATRAGEARRRGGHGAQGRVHMCQARSQRDYWVGIPSRLARRAHARTGSNAKRSTNRTQARNHRPPRGGGTTATQYRSGPLERTMCRPDPGPEQRAPRPRPRRKAQPPPHPPPRGAN
jgi:hypothetical protein